MISVVIPARNEGGVIGRALAAITEGALPGELEVIVVCNGCTDDTADIAGDFGPPVRVVECEKVGKSHALNLGDQLAQGFPRVYVDADVVITMEGIRALAQGLQGEILVTAPTAQVDLNGCSWAVCAFYNIRGYLPSATEGIGGSGVYALSQNGRRRFLEFPQITADDGYVRLQFRRNERQTLNNVYSRVFAPRRLRDLMLVRTRACYGTAQLYRKYPHLRQNAGRRNHESLASLWMQVSLWPQLGIYVYVSIMARYRSALRRIRQVMDWERDESSRAAL
jgi:glycosyltransferase involved in cell wall biosynthesis